MMMKKINMVNLVNIINMVNMNTADSEGRGSEI